MAQLVRRAVLPGALSAMAIACALACSPGYVSADSQSDGTDTSSDEGSGGTDGTGGSDGSDGSGGADGAGGSDGTGGGDSTGGSDGSGGSDDGTGGSEPGSGGFNNGTGGVDSSCDQNDSCVAAANFNDECFSPDCSSPIAVKQSEVDRDICLVPWNDRQAEIPEECAAHSPPPSPCPGICEVPPPCVSATCAAGECTLVVCVP